MSTWIIIIAGGILTFLIRLSFIAIFGKKEMPALLRRGLRFVPPAVLSAIIFQQVFYSSSQINLSPTNPRLLASLVAVLVAWRTRNTFIVILAGMIAILLLQQWFGG